MDRAAANTLRTLGIILTSLLMIGVCGLLLLLSFCAGILSQTSHDHTVAAEFFFAAVFVLIVGVLIVLGLSRGIFRDTQPQAATSILASPSSTPPFVLDPPQHPPSPTATPGTAPISVPPPLPLTYAPASARVSTQVDPSHFSRASREAIQNLIYAIAALIAIDVLFLLLPAFGIHALRTHAIRPNPFVWGPGFSVLPYLLITGFLNVAPYIVLLVALRRAPGPRAFAYALAVPAIPAAWGLLTIPALLIGVAGAQVGTLMNATIALVPVALDWLIFYFAWIAISRTGIHPPPKRLIIASVVILIYRLFVVSVAAVIFTMASKIFPGH